jgi:hypothetical protein
MKAYTFVNDGKTRDQLTIPLVVIQALENASQEGSAAKLERRIFTLLPDSSPLRLIPYSVSKSSLESNNLSLEYVNNPKNQYVFENSICHPRLFFQVIWNRLYKHRGFVVILLTQDNRFVASVQGILEHDYRNSLGKLGPEILSVQVHPDFQRQGFCSKIVSLAFHLLNQPRLSLEGIALSNGAGLIGSKCYEKAARENKFTWTCDTESPEGICQLYEFHSHAGKSTPFSSFSSFSSLLVSPLSPLSKSSYHKEIG